MVLGLEIAGSDGHSPAPDGCIICRVCQRAGIALTAPLGDVPAAFRLDHVDGPRIGIAAIGPAAAIASPTRIGVVVVWVPGDLWASVGHRLLSPQIDGVTDALECEHASERSNALDQRCVAVWHMLTSAQ